LEFAPGALQPCTVRGSIRSRLISRRIRHVFAAALAALAAACNCNGAGVDRLRFACSSDRECADGFSCVGGTCARPDAGGGGMGGSGGGVGGGAAGGGGGSAGGSGGDAGDAGTDGGGDSGRD